jgi:hypothetical protein
MPLLCHCERPMGAWQSHSASTGLLRRFTPRNDNLLIAFVLITKTTIEHSKHQVWIFVIGNDLLMGVRNLGIIF